MTEDPTSATPTWLARRLLRSRDRVALATARADGHPYVSLAAVATDYDGSPLLLLSDIAEHTRNLAADPRAALLFEESAGHANPQTGPRISVLGRIERALHSHQRDRYLARHPSAAAYAGFADFATFSMKVERMNWVGGFGKAGWLTDGVLLPAPLADAFAARCPGLITALPADLGQGLAKVAGKRGQGWRVAGLDADGAELVRGGVAHRLVFPVTAGSPEEAVAFLERLAAR